MAPNSACSVFIGNLDERVSEKVLYEILIQAGRVVDLHIPRERETNRHRGIAFAEYESEEIADYAIRLFSGLVRLYNKTLRFAFAGQDKLSKNGPDTQTTTGVSTRDANNAHESAKSMAGRGFSGFSTTPPSSSNHHARDGLSGRGSYEYSRRVFGSVVTDIRSHSLRR